MEELVLFVISVGGMNKMEWKEFTKEQHRKKHTLKENTHSFECKYCEGV